MRTEHPFLTFRFDPKCLDPRTWFLLGEAMSKCQHLAGTPLKPHAARNLLSVYLAKGAQATTAIEGNTLSDDEVAEIVRRGSAGVPKSRVYQEREVQNVLKAIGQIDIGLQTGMSRPIDREHLCELNRLLLQDIPDRPEVVPGTFREHDVVAGRYRAPHWTQVPELVDQLTAWLAQLHAPTSSPEDRFVSAMLTATLCHLYIAWIHPFGNGNGRLARLVEVQLLSESGVVPIVSTNLLSNHYNKTRSAYYLALDAAQRDVSEFIRYAVQGFVDELRDQIAFVRKESLVIHWESWVHEVFRAKPNTSARDRQRELALALPRGGKTVTPEQAVELTASLARKYATAGERMPARDLNDLVKLDLARRVGKRAYVAMHEAIEAFIPAVAIIE